MRRIDVSHREKINYTPRAHPPKLPKLTVEDVLSDELKREMNLDTDTLAADFDKVNVSESRKKQLAQFTKTLSMYRNLMFTKGKKKVGYGTLMHFPKLKANPDRSVGIVPAARIVVGRVRHDRALERGKLDDPLVEVKPYINLLGDLYHQTRKM